MRCSQCRHVWFQEPIEETPIPEDVLTEAEATSQPVSNKIPATRPQPAKPKKRKIPLWPIAATVAGLCIMITALTLTMPKAIAKTLPFTATALETLGIKTPVLGEGLKFDNLRTESFRSNNGIIIFVLGEIHNDTDQDIILPNLLITISDSADRQIKQWVQDTDKIRIPAQSAYIFNDQQLIDNELANSVSIKFTDISIE